MCVCVCVCPNGCTYIVETALCGYFKNPPPPRHTLHTTEPGEGEGGGIGACSPIVHKGGSNGIWPHRCIDLSHFCDLRFG